MDKKRTFIEDTYSLLVDHRLGCLEAILRHLPERFDVREVPPRMGVEEDIMIIISLKKDESEISEKTTENSPERGPGFNGGEHSSTGVHSKKETKETSKDNLGILT